MNYTAYKRQFFLKISANCKYIDQNVVADVYQAMIQTVVDEVLEKHTVYLPRFGLLKLIDSDKTWMPGRGCYMDEAFRHKRIKFTLSSRLKNYIKRVCN